MPNGDEKREEKAITPGTRPKKEYGRVKRTVRVKKGERDRE
jgi:hypothetical protein